MRRVSFIHPVLWEPTMSVEEQLREANRNGQIQPRYAPFPGRRKRESPEEFAVRMRTHALRYQFVRVIFNGENHYVAFGASGPIITKFGKFALVPAQVVGGRWGVHNFLFSADPALVLRHKAIFIRLDSGCVSGQVFGDITCDCREQLEIALRTCAEKKVGMVVHIPEHDGRGWGQFKSSNQRIMDECGLNTVEAARLFYGDEETIDQRTYTEAVIILRAFGFGSRHIFSLGTNNPRKMGAFIALGMNLNGTCSITTKEHNPLLERNLRAKAQQWQHNFSNIPVSQEISLRKP